MSDLLTENEEKQVYELEMEELIRLWHAYKGTNSETLYALASRFFTVSEKFSPFKVLGMIRNYLETNYKQTPLESYREGLYRIKIFKWWYVTEGTREYDGDWKAVKLPFKVLNTDFSIMKPKDLEIKLRYIFTKSDSSTAL